MVKDHSQCGMSLLKYLRLLLCLVYAQLLQMFYVCWGNTCILCSLEAELLKVHQIKPMVLILIFYLLAHFCVLSFQSLGEVS